LGIICIEEEFSAKTVLGIVILNLDILGEFFQFGLATRQITKNPPDSKDPGSVS
jgi:hypothetical protein